jgi:hypothetical protein
MEGQKGMDQQTDTRYGWMDGKINLNMYLALTFIEFLKNLKRDCPISKVDIHSWAA